MATQVAIEDLSDWLLVQPDNTASTPYEIEITGLQVSDFDIPNQNPIRTALLANNSKYVDLSATQLPNGVTSIGDENVGGAFSLCSTLCVPPIIPNNVWNMSRAFQESGITVAPNIPENVTSLERTFKGCFSLISVPNIPASVTDLSYTFYDCSSLEEITLFQADVKTIVEEHKSTGCFEGCTSLTSIGLIENNPAEADDWHIYSLHFEEDSGTDYVSGTVYDRDGTTHTITPTAITKDDLTLPILTDELWFPDSAYDSDPTAIPTIIQKMITYRYGIFKRETIPPDEKTLVLMADDENNVVTNCFVRKSDIVDVVEKENMNPVTSNAVAVASASKNLYASSITTTETSYQLNGKLSDYKYLVICGLDTGVRVRGSIIMPRVYINQGFIVNCYSSSGSVAVYGVYVDDTHIKLRTSNANTIAYCYIGGLLS